jgi:hypothetical protein
MAGVGFDEQRVIEILIAAGRVRDPWGSPIDAVAKMIPRTLSAREVVTGLVTRGMVHWVERVTIGPKGIRVTYSWRRGSAPAVPKWDNTPVH